MCVLKHEMLLKILIFSYIVYEQVRCDRFYGPSTIGPVVRTPLGLVEGIRIVTDYSKEVDAFLGIPYASPPIGENRFAPPKKHTGWNGTYRAVSYGNHCPQLPQKPGTNDVEDCLYLNIWAPANALYYGPLPVIIFLEGHEFSKSSEIQISGQDLATEGIVVISINYRLNVFGFFCLANSKARGNMGLLDQYFALLWVKENAKQFGGDPQKITLYGHSSGAVSVMLHMLSPRTAGLFQRAIITSGSVTTPWMSKNDPVKASEEIIRILGCNIYTRDSVACLRSRKVEDILQALQEYAEAINWTDDFLPVVDNFLPQKNRYLPEDPIKILKDGTYFFKDGNNFQVPILTGLSKPIRDSQEVQWIELASKGANQLQDYIEKAKIPELIRLYRFDTPNRDTIFDIIKWKYFSIDTSDTTVLYKQLKNVEFISKIEAPFFMQLSYLVSSYVQPIFVYFMDDLNMVINVTDCTITADLILIFGPVILKSVGRRRFSPSEQRLSKQMKQMWRDFITFGNPTPNINQNVWRKYSAVDNFVENFGTSYSNVVQEINRRIERISFWNQLLPKLSLVKNNLSNNIPKELQNSPDPSAGFRHALYTLVGLAVALLALLVVCIFLLKKKSKERETQFHMGY